MIVGVYGTLRVGYGLHHALASSQFMGHYRAERYDTVMLQTRAGYPAVVQASGDYLNTLVEQAESAWEEHLANNPLTRDSRERTGWTGGLDMPLMELYSCSGAVVDRLDMVEGVESGLYTRTEVTVVPMREDMVTRARTQREFQEAWTTSTEQMDDVHQVDADSRKQLARREYAKIYTMEPSRVSLQGCRVIWNGDFHNPLYLDGVVWNYNDWIESLQDRLEAAPSIAIQRGGMPPRMDWT